MKKLLAVVLVLTLVLSMGVMAFADGGENEDDGIKDWSPVEVSKKITLGNAGTVNPAETFNFTVGKGSGLRDGANIAAPDFEPETFQITVAQGEEEGFANITLPDFNQVGVYTYPIIETAGNTAGFDYDEGTYYLVVTVINNPNYVEGETPKFLRVLTLTDENDVKDDKFKNSFNAGNLTVNKVITGNYADPNDVFEITVVVTPEEGKVINNSTITWNTEDVTEAEGGAYTAVYKLKGGESFTIQNLPYDVDYKVVEAQATGYDAPQYDENKEGEMNAAAITTTITNNRDQEIATGINLDNLPYILILGAVTIGLFGFTMKRRFNNR